MIKKYDEYENFDEKDFESFIKILKTCQSYFKKISQNNISSSFQSYSRIAQTNKNPDTDFALIDKFMTKYGWPIEKVRKLAHSIPLFTYEVESSRASDTGAIDYYLYKITNHEFPLSGLTWTNDVFMNSLEPDENEYLIKYAYGWHKTSYGKLIIKQNLNSIESFMEKVIEFLPIKIIVSIIDSNNSYYWRFTPPAQREIIKKLAENIWSDDLNEIYVDTQKLLENLTITESQKNPLTVPQFLSSLDRSLHIIREEFKKSFESKPSQEFFDQYVSNILDKCGLKNRIRYEGTLIVTVF
jgi:hypothetical protein